MNDKQESIGKIKLQKVALDFRKKCCKNDYWNVMKEKLAFHINFLLYQGV